MTVKGDRLDLDSEYLKDIDPLSLTNTVTMSALVAVLVRKGILTDQELTEEVRQIRERVGQLTQDKGKGS